MFEVQEKVLRWPFSQSLEEFSRLAPRRSPAVEANLHPEQVTEERMV